MDFKDFIVKNYPTGITKLTLNRLDSCWQAATERAARIAEEHIPLMSCGCGSAIAQKIKRE